MGNTVKCTGKAFRDLTDDYAGGPLEVVMLVDASGEPKFAAPKAYSTRMRHPTAAAAYKAWTRRDGLEGVRSGQIVCAYTGELLRPATDGATHWFEGGVDLRMFRPKAEFLYYATMRGGKSKYPKPEPCAHVETVREKPDRQALAHEMEPTDESMRRAEAVMKKTGFKPPKRTVVSVPGRKGK